MDFVEPRFGVESEFEIVGVGVEIEIVGVGVGIAEAGIGVVEAVVDLTVGFGLADYFGYLSFVIVNYFEGQIN